MKRYLLTIPIFALVLFFAFFGGVSDAGAQTTTSAPNEVVGTCTVTYYVIVAGGGISKIGTQTLPNMTVSECDLFKEPSNGSIPSVVGAKYTTAVNDRIRTKPGDVTPTGIVPTSNSEDPNAFQNSINEGCPSIIRGTLTGCLLKFIYYFYFQLPTFILYVAAYVFNILMSLVIQDSMYQHDFINNAWSVVRDLSNVFFILILLYIGIKTVLGMGGHETKKVITSVVLMALLINFSMFFTRIVIDSSNMLALIFYRELDTKYETETGEKVERPFTSVTPGKEKDAAGALYSKFDATRLMRQEVVSQIGATTVNSIPVLGNLESFGIKFGIIVVSGTIMIVAAYVFFVSGIFFLGRIIDLWILMITAPFAFMSYALPSLAHTEYGWSKWTEKLISVAFMAPAFMFFLYLIFLILGTKNFFSGFIDPSNTSWIGILMGIFLPAAIILGLLLKAKDLAKKAGGQFGETVMSGAKLAGGLALGATGAGVAALGTRYVGGAAMKTLADKGLRERALSGDTAAQKEIERAGRNVNRSFDFRDTKLGKFVADKSGVKFTEGRISSMLGLDTHAFEGGIAGQIKHAKEHEEKNIKAYMLSAGEANEQDTKAEIANKEIEERQKQYNKELKKARETDPLLDEDKFKEEFVKNNGSLEKVATAKDINDDIKRRYFAQKESHHDAEGLKAAMKDLVKALKTTGKASGAGMAGSAAMGAYTGGAAGALGAVTVTGAVLGTGIPIAGGMFLKKLKNVLKNEGAIHAYGLAEAKRPKSNKEKLAEAVKELGLDNKKESHGGGGGHAPSHSAPPHKEESHGPTGGDHGSGGDHGNGHN